MRSDLPACTVQRAGIWVVCARSYTDGTFTGSSTPVAPALAVVLSASAIGRVFHSRASRDPGASASARAHRVSVSRDCDANASEDLIALATAVFGAPAPVDRHITPVDEHIARAPAVIAVQRLWTSTLRQRHP